MLSRWPTNRPFGSLAASGTLSKFFGLKATKKPFLPSALAAAGSEWVSTSTATRPASISCWKRRRIAEPPERNISTLMPFSFWKASTIFWPWSIGVEVYQITLPSAFALATSTASWAWAGVSSANSASAQSGEANFMTAFPCSVALFVAGLFAGHSGARAQLASPESIAIEPIVFNAGASPRRRRWIPGSALRAAPE